MNIQPAKGVPASVVAPRLRTMTDINSYALPFGKWKGSKIPDVPLSYLQFLCAWHNSKRNQRTNLRSARKWVFKNCPNAITAARQHVIRNKLCRECFKPLVPVGYARANGSAHADWESRKFHKRCWKELPSDTESSESESD